MFSNKTIFYGIKHPENYTRAFKNLVHLTNWHFYKKRSKTNFILILNVRENLFSDLIFSFFICSFLLKLRKKC